MSGIVATTPIDAAEVQRLQEAARKIRIEVIRAVYHARAGHLGGPLSAADFLAALYFHELRIRPRSRPGRTVTASSCPRAIRPSACTPPLRCAATCRSRSC